MSSRDREIEPLLSTARERNKHQYVDRSSSSSQTPLEILPREEATHAQRRANGVDLRLLCSLLSDSVPGQPLHSTSIFPDSRFVSYLSHFVVCSAEFGPNYLYNDCRA